MIGLACEMSFWWFLSPWRCSLLICRASWKKKKKKTKIAIYTWRAWELYQRKVGHKLTHWCRQEGQQPQINIHSSMIVNYSSSTSVLNFNHQHITRQFMKMASVQLPIHARGIDCAVIHKIIHYIRLLVSVILFPYSFTEGSDYMRVSCMFVSLHYGVCFRQYLYGTLAAYASQLKKKKKRLGAHIFL